MHPFVAEFHVEGSESSSQAAMDLELHDGAGVANEDLHRAWMRVHKCMKRRRRERKEERRLAHTRVILMLWMWQTDQSPLNALPFEVVSVIIECLKSNARTVGWW